MKPERQLLVSIPKHRCVSTSGPLLLRQLEPHELGLLNPQIRLQAESIGDRPTARSHICVPSWRPASGKESPLPRLVPEGS
jgi:hypothetical protein